MTLCEIARQCGTDKGPDGHWYTRWYSRHLSKFLGKRPRVLEIGVQEGFSLKMWKAFFPDGEVYGVDINPACKGDGIFIGTQSDENFMEGIGAAIHPDIVVDDGSHYASDQRASFRALWPHLAPGGVYCIEDLHLGYHTDRSFIEDDLSGLIHDVNANGKTGMWDISHVPNNPKREEVEVRLSLMEKEIESIHFYRSLVIIEKVA